MTLSVAAMGHPEPSVRGLSAGRPTRAGDVEMIAGNPASGLLLLCDHASNMMPAELEGLGLPQAELERHIAYDIGAADMTRAMAAHLGAPAILTSFSRLIIDPNRGLDDPTLVMRLSDGAIVPGNARLTDADIEARVARYYRPYDAAIAQAVEVALAAGYPPAIVSLHSFTPIWKGAQRPWHVGVLWEHDTRLAAPLLTRLALEPDLVVGDNEPYSGGLPGDTIHRHATVRGLPDVLIEVRQDLISTPETAWAWGARLAPMIGACVAQFHNGQAAT